MIWIGVKKIHIVQKRYGLSEKRSGVSGKRSRLYKKGLECAKGLDCTKEYIHWMNGSSIYTKEVNLLKNQ